MLELVSDPMSTLTFDLAMRLTDRQIYEIYLKPQLEKQRREKAKSQGPTSGPTMDGAAGGVKHHANSVEDPSLLLTRGGTGFIWETPQATEDAEVEIHGRKVNAEAVLRNLARLNMVDPEQVKRACRERDRLLAKQREIKSDATEQQ